MAKKKSDTKQKKLYTCKTCGNISTSKGHLCSPVPQENSFVCDFCGKTACDPRHVCAPKVSSFKFSCGNCGRVAISKDDLCSPVKIPQAKIKTARTTKKAKKSSTK